MANPNFIATMSSDEIWRGTDNTRCITDDLDAIEDDILELEQNKADEDHAHSYNDLSDKPSIPSAYTHPENHPASMITGLATVATSGNYDDLSGKPTNPQMLLGVEYLTNEKWNGESLYTTIVNCGNFENGKNVDTELSCQSIVRYCGCIGGYAIPFFHYGVDSAWSCWVEVSNYWNNVRITMRGGESIGSVPVQVQVWYTKPPVN